MSVEDTLAERGKRYGEFTDHAEICQRIKLAMIAGSARWTRLSDVQKQALEVIADKIARILSGDPNYADNWHDIQGYAKLVEDRLPKAPMTFSERCAEIDAEVHAAAGRIRQEGETIIVSTPEQHAAIYAALGAVPNADGGTVSIHFGAQPFCVECEHPDDGTGTHYATCSKLTAPKEFVEQVEATFDELENPSPVFDDPKLEAQVTAATEQLVETLNRCTAEPKPLCPGCGREEGLKHRRGCAARWPELAESAPKDDPFAGAPEWAKYKAQDAGGRWFWYEKMPSISPANLSWEHGGQTAYVKLLSTPAHNPNWRDTLIERP